MTKEVSVFKTYSLDKPSEMIAMANVLKQHIIKQNLYTTIKGRNYVQVEGWAFAGFLTGLTAIIEEVKDLSTDKEIKWSAMAKIYAGDKVVSTGYAICSNKETIKKTFDEYAILSMCQTRCLGKAYRNKLGWVIKLAGYDSTPAEEMKKVDNTEASFTPPPPPKTEIKTAVKNEFAGMVECHECAAMITKQVADYSKKMFRKPLCRNCQAELKGKK